MANEERASGISLESTDLNDAIESIIGLSDAAEGELNKIESRNDAEKQREQQTADSGGSEEKVDGAIS